MVTAFLNDLESSRKITPRSRNLRLAAIRSFFRYAAYEEPARAEQIQRVLAMSTTMIYTHVLNRGKLGVNSPLDSDD
jgi:site-specific recombinase XerD